ncbi:hypothetical protein BDZ97DRAFT_1916597 [Flammula alnicola]|nr:hypothetical protein BDZ97DRAFT_1916597 [Flammula alnicola]
MFNSLITPLSRSTQFYEAMFLCARLAALVGSKIEGDTVISRPIGTIPVEILILIFEEYCRAWDSSATSTLPELHITHVCQYWRSIAINLSTLWTRLVILPWTPPFIATIYLQRSQSLPLDLEIDLRYDALDAAKHERVLGTWKAIKSSVSRWRRLNIQTGTQDATSFSEDLRELGAPLLEQLRMSSGSHVAGLTKVFQGGMPSLKSLHLIGVSLLRFTPSLQLTRLHLTSNCPMHVSVFRRLMSNMTYLEELTIRNRVVEGWPLYPSSEDIIRLPSLTVLKLSDRRWPLFVPLLSFSAPLLHTLSLYDLVAHDLPETLMETQLSEQYPSIRNLILKGKSSFIDDVSFAQLARIFPTVDHFALLDVNSSFVNESCQNMHQTSIWPKLRTISMIPVVAEDILCSLVSARTIPTTATPLKMLVVPVPTQFKRLDWITQQVNVEEYQDSSFSLPQCFKCIDDLTL